MELTIEEQYAERYRKALMAIKKLKTELENEKNKVHTNEPIAIIGIGCRFPGNVTDVQSFWNVLINKNDNTSEIPLNRWNNANYYSPEVNALGKTNVLKANFINDLEYFDNEFFGISGREALYMDPMQRKMLEVNVEALQNAGIDIFSLKNSNTSVYVGVTVDGYEERHIKSGYNSLVDIYSITGYMKTAFAGRLPYFLDLRGAAVTVDTGCSASLVALHHACQTLQNGEADLALAVGVNALLSPSVYVALSTMNAIAPDGRCKSFSADADGFGRGDGFATLVLKRLSDAQKNNDRIYAVIKSTAINQDGRSNGFTAPNPQAQSAVILSALKKSGLNANDNQYVETHGTGTPLGDPIEIEGIRNSYLLHRQTNNPLLIGALKTNFGHTEGASGLASVIKVALSLYNEQIPPNMNFTKPNEYISWEGLQLVNSLHLWKKSEKSRNAGVSAFGISGTNAHAIISESPNNEQIEQNILPDYHLFSLSAQNRNVLKQNALKYISFLKKTNHSLYEICYNSALRQTHFRNRISLVANSKEEMATLLKAYYDGELDDIEAFQIDQLPHRIAFIYSGLEAKVKSLGWSLYNRFPVYKQAIQKVAEIFQQNHNINISKFYKKEKPSFEMNVKETVALNLAMQVALTELWLYFGVEPAIISGYESGEITAALFAEKISIADAANIAILLTDVAQKYLGDYNLLLVENSLEEVKNDIQNFGNEAGIYMIPNKTQVIITGKNVIIDALLHKYHALGIDAKKLNTVLPFFEGMNENIINEVNEKLKNIHFLETKKMFHTNESLFKNETSDVFVFSPKTFFLENFIHNLKYEKVTLYHEITRTNNILPYIEEIIEQNGISAQIIPQFLKAKLGAVKFLATLGKLHSFHVPVQLNKLFTSSATTITLPTYEWQKNKFWLEDVSGKNQIIETVELNKTSEDENLVDALKNCTTENEKELLLMAYLRKHFSKISATNQQKIKNNTNLLLLGIDSMMFMRMNNALKKHCGLQIPIKTFYKTPTIQDLANYLLTSLQNLPPLSKSEKTDNSYFINFSDNKHAELQLFCFHDAGGNASMYGRWSEILGNKVQVIALQLPGRSNRFEEQPLTSMEEVIQNLLHEFVNAVKMPFAFFGHSMGAVIMMELANRLRKNFDIQPNKVFISSAPPFQKIAEQVAEYNLPETKLLQRFPELNKQLFLNTADFEAFLNTLRADLQLLYFYKPEAWSPFSFPIFLLHAENDKRVKLDDAILWKEYTTKNFTLLKKQGTHRHVYEYQVETIQLLKEYL